MDLETAYARIPRELLWCCLRAHHLPETYVQTIMDMSEGSTTITRRSCGYRESFTVRVGLCQGSALNPLLFEIVMDNLTQEIRGEAPYSMVFTNDIMVYCKDKYRLERDLQWWRAALEKKWFTNQQRNDRIHAMLY